MELDFVFALLVEGGIGVGVVVVDEQIFIGRGVEDGVVNAVDDAVQIVFAAAKEPVKVFAEVFVLNFLRVPS